MADTTAGDRPSRTTVLRSILRRLVSTPLPDLSPRRIYAAYLCGEEGSEITVPRFEPIRIDKNYFLGRIFTRGSR